MGGAWCLGTRKSRQSYLGIDCESFLRGEIRFAVVMSWFGSVRLVEHTIALNFLALKKRYVSTGTKFNSSAAEGYSWVDIVVLRWGSEGVRVQYFDFAAFADSWGGCFSELRGDIIEGVASEYQFTYSVVVPYLNRVSLPKPNAALVGLWLVWCLRACCQLIESIKKNYIF